MVFGNSALQIDHSAGFGIHFNALDALKLVDNKHDLMKVAVAEEWQNSRWEKITCFYDTSVYSDICSLCLFMQYRLNQREMHSHSHRSKEQNLLYSVVVAKKMIL